MYQAEVLNMILWLVKERSDLLLSIPGLDAAA